MAETIIKRREAWLRQKKLTIRQVADAVGDEADTVRRWFHDGRTPRKRYLVNVKTVFPDFPLPSFAVPVVAGPKRARR